MIWARSTYPESGQYSNLGAPNVKRSFVHAGGLLHACVKHSGFNFPCTLDLHKDPVLPGTRKSVRETDFRWHRCARQCHGHPGVRLVRSSRLPQRRHGNRSCRMHVGKYAQIFAHELCVPSHSQIGLQIDRGLSVLVLHAECETHRPTCYQRFLGPQPDHASAIGRPPRGSLAAFERSQKAGTDLALRPASHRTFMPQAGIVRPASFSHRFQTFRPIASRYSAAYDYRFMLTARPHSFTPRVRFALAFCAFAVFFGPGLRMAIAQESPEILPLSQVRPGMQGYAYTIFAGDQVEKFDLEVLGVLDNFLGPKQPIILVQLKGPKVEHTGVVAGMSGSPVYLDGKLAGALSLKLGIFTKEAIAGVTPIENILSLPKGQPPGTILAGEPQGTIGNETVSTAQQFEMPSDWAMRS